MFIKFIFLLALTVSTSSVFAAESRISQLLPSTNDLKSGDEVLIAVDILSDGVEYNAIEGRLDIPKTFDVVKVITGDSFISVWLEDPTVSTDNSIRFSGIAPAGYNRDIGRLFSVIARANSSGTGSLILSDIGIFRNDGVGTQDNVSDQRLSLSVREIKSGEQPYLIGVQDVTPPEAFSIQLVRDSSLFENKFAIIWNTTDKGSGIASYDVIEGKNVFKQAKSPYVLDKQGMRGKIYVRAYDHEGNMTQAALVPPGKFCIGTACYGLAEVFVVVIFFSIIIFILCRKQKSS